MRFIKKQYQLILALSAIIAVFACSQSDESSKLIPLDKYSLNLNDQLSVLGEAIGESRIVLLGENGHGVADFTEIKVKLIEWLHKEKGFDVLVFESGFFECGFVWKNIDSLSPREALYSSLRYPFQHKELLPLFEYIKIQSNTQHPLVLAGMDIQEQGLDTEARLNYIDDMSKNFSENFQSNLKEIDRKIFQLEKNGGLEDDVCQFSAIYKDSITSIYNKASQQTKVWDKWMFILSSGLVDKFSVRGNAEINNRPRGSRYSEIRDEWMAKAVSALADSIDGERKVVVYLHNDHGRYGPLDANKRKNKSAGMYLKELYPNSDDVFSVGFFMGHGEVTDNGRNLRMVEPDSTGTIESFLAKENPNASYVILKGNTNDSVVQWSNSEQSYARMGFRPQTMIPAEEFDALIYIDSVRPPIYRIPFDE